MKTLLVAEGRHELDGALRAIVSRVLPAAIIVQDKVSRPTIHAHHGRGRGYFKRAVRWLLEAEKRGYELLVLVIDCDRQDIRIKVMQQAQEYGNARILRALGVAVQSFDAWMFADETAMSKVIGTAVQTQPNPESINDAKRHLAVLLDQFPCDLAQSKIYEQLCMQLRFDVVAHRCAKGFAPFLEHLQAIAGSLNL